ncbi:uncharacterized protein LOC116290796 [Actinia tenebrosa]|uniref:Uncharacterized protein LOC116290796 n=1 Tax=Actinia tenebrosa TaxID=6105 RepID=A0A6P8HM85_ACTTE|nr:uncharacterized protein LOC116290796 [Actinia tenebrosa]
MTDELREPLLSSDPVRIQQPGIPDSYMPHMMYTNDTMIGSLPFSTSPIFGISPDSFGEIHREAELQFLNLDEHTVFEKVQSRKGGLAKMRVCNAGVKMVCSSPYQLLCIKAFVFREKEAAKLHGDENGKVEIPVVMGNMEVQQGQRFYKQFFSVDLDSVYDGPKKPVYELAKVEMEARNKFQVSIQVQYVDGLGYQEFTSVPFLMKTRPRKRTRLESESDVQSPDTSRPRKDSGESLDVSSSSNSSPGADFISSTEYKSAEYNHVKVLDHLEAKRATFDHVTCRVMQCQSNADIGYHFKLRDQNAAEQYDEGDVVGFFKDENGKAVIELLDSENADDAFMAGVISRSAYLEAKQSLLEEETDIICVIGVVKVKCIGSVRAGERIYSSLEKSKPGTAIAESHLPSGAVLSSRGTLLGMALEERKTKMFGDENLVKCFVCIVMGVTDKKLNMEIEDIYDHFEYQLSNRLRKERKRAKRILIAVLFVLGLFLASLAFLCFELYWPGSALRVYFCERHSLKHHTATFKYTPDGIRAYNVRGIEFPSWETLQKKIAPIIDQVPPLNMSRLNVTKVHYYLNLDRCSYGGTRLYSALNLDPKKEVGGPLVFAINQNCTNVYYYTDVPFNHWKPYISVSTFPQSFHCHPESEFKNQN